MATTVNMSTVDTEASDWSHSAESLARWALLLANRTDAWGEYGANGGFTNKGKLTEETLLDHFRGRTIIGLHTTSAQNTSKWLVVDLDQHGDSTELADKNRHFALKVDEHLRALGFRPIVEDSDGHGSFHVWLIFSAPVPTECLYAFGRWLIEGRTGGLDVEVFPKQPRIDASGYGNWMRLPGTHHTRDHWSRIWDGSLWLTGADAIDVILSTRGDNSSLIPTEATEWRPRHQGQKQALVAEDPKRTLEDALSALDCILPSQLSYNDWLQVGMALHSLGPSLLPHFDRWSRDDERYKSGEPAAKWATFNGGPITIATLFYHAKRFGWQHSSRATVKVGTRRVISNAHVTRVDNRRIAKPLSMAEIVHNITTGTDGWPRRVRDALFVHPPNTDDVTWLSSTDAFFGWIGSATGVPPQFERSADCHTQAHVFHELRRLAQNYIAVETLPHEPVIPGHYYAYRTPQPGDGKALQALVERYNPETDIDGDLIKAAFVTTVWGGAGGSRPAFLIDSAAGRGAGKSTVAGHIAYFAGGAVSLSANGNADLIYKRLLAPEGMTKRVALLDNVKSLRFSWAELEALITCPTISGYRNYVGEGSRPNTLLWLITLNGASLAKDLAQRCVIVKIGKANHGATWAEETRSYIDEHRGAIIADCIGVLRSERFGLAKYTRWGTWEHDVLERLPEPSKAQSVILERQAVADVEDEEAGLIQDFFAQRLQNLGYDPEQDCVFIPSALAADWFCTATRERITASAVSRRLNQSINEETITRLSVNRCNAWGRGFVWHGAHSAADTRINTDVESRWAIQDERRRP